MRRQRIAESKLHHDFQTGMGHCIERTGNRISKNAGGIKMGDVQIWVGQCIDPTVHIAKFITAGGRPVAPSVAAAEFGTQTYLFSGSAEDFIVNQGTGGDFTKTGTVTDYTPGPT
ncbi:hypothetical protein [Bradyrhizobium sp. URHD0069]|uniref:hypothetical protein n=1 Tax=Bradyrhizobium sp. URHD0069 TaxID=1380355 RepID=UPI000498229D|nr:hypothetical protein [Bradyrhizobium sp. URHD0069]